MSQKVLGLALRLSADTTRLRLTPAERALKQLGEETDKVTKVFEQFADESAAAGKAQDTARKAFGDLAQQLQAGSINAQQFAERYAALGAAVNREAEAFRRAAQITEQNISPLEKYRRTTAELAEQLKAGRITQETYNAAVGRAKGDLDRATGAARQTGASLDSVSKQLTTIARIQVARAFIDGFQAIGSVVRRVQSQVSQLVNGVRQSLDQIDKLSLRTGVSREALQGFGVAAELAGVSTEELGGTLQRLAVNIGQAQPPAALTRGLQQLGLTAQELRRLAPEDQFSLIASRISALPSAAERAAAAFAVFGRQGAQLTSLLQQQGNALEEVRQRSERLGIIVRDDQIANVTQLNDTFTLVRKTIEGIIGQVAGNLAPLVTAIGESFLEFVETFTGFNATGGTAVADAITDSLLTGAEFLAGVFDFTVKQFEGFSVTFKDVVDGFSVASSVLSATVSAGEAVFRLLESTGNLIMLGIGKVLEQIGRLPFLKDLRESGRALADAAFEKLEENADRFVAAVDRTVGTVEGAIFGETPAEAGERGAGAAENYVNEFRRKLEDSRTPEFRVNTNIEKTRDAFDDFFGGVIDQSSRVTELMREFEAAVSAAFEDAELTADEVARIEELQRGVNAAIKQEVALRSEAVEAANKQAEADAKRIDSLLKTTDATQKIVDDLSAVEREIARVQQDIAETGELGSLDRLNELRALQGQLEEQLQAAAQGFEQGFDKAFEATGQNFSRLAEQAEKFGQAGFDAAARLQEGIAAAQQQARDGILNREAFEAEVARQQKLFEQEIEQVRQVADERKRVNEFVDQQFLLARFGGDQQRLAAAQRVAEVEREIVRVQGEIQAARAAGNQEAVNAGIQRLGLLDQVAAKERDIASGRQKFEEQIAQQREQYLQQLAEQQKKAEEEQKKFAEERARAIEAENQRQRNRIRELNTLGAGTIGGNDIRTSEGAALFLQLAANRQDPMLIEARLQTRALTGIRGQVTALVQGLTGLPTVRIPGAIG